MNDDLTPEQRDAIGALRASRGPCPSAETLIEYEALSAEARARHAAHAHIQVCSRCQLVLLHVGSTGASVPVASTGWVRWALPLAAVAILAVALTLVERRGGTSVPPGMSVPPAPSIPPGTETVRGTDLQLMAPLGAVEQVRAFSWQSPVRVDRYRVVVRRGSDVVWQAETAGSSITPPAGLFVRDVPYEWHVEALDREGAVRLASPPQSFTVY